MAAWSAENATKAYLKTMKMGKCAKELNGAEFISALAAGNNSQMIVITCAKTADSTTLALAAAAQQTGGNVICILRGLDQLRESEKALGGTSSHIQFVIGDAKNQLLNHYQNADFLAIDCNLENHEEILNCVKGSDRKNNTIVIGYNAFCKESWRSSHFQTQLLPIGDGLLVKRIVAGGNSRGVGHDNNNNNNGGLRKTGRWIVRVDKCTGEQHVFRVRSNDRRAVHA
ncbi:hypothetical protein LIER_25054 [Lithospermum erythrorhizon]|uniref:Uncharacterized protein n=1 Tax=Lithospermum erythrorhizon TaxID=34254 RepID=A0AAV3R3G5_LITER